MTYSIKTKIALWLLGLMLVTALVVGSSAYFILFDALAKNQKDNLLFVARGEAERLAEFIEHKERRFKNIALSDDVKRYSKTFSESLLFGFFYQFRHEFPVLTFVTKQGKEEFRISGGNNSIDLVDTKETALYKDLIKVPGTVITHISEVGQDLGPYARMGFHRENFFGEFEGIVTARIPFYKFFKAFRETR